LHVGIFLWHLAGLHDSVRVKLSTRKVQLMGISNSQAVYQALASLERHRLLLVERRPGCCPVITLITRCHVAPATSTAPDLS
jgi:hypothetical protein